MKGTDKHESQNNKINRAAIWKKCLFTNASSKMEHSLFFYSFKLFELLKMVEINLKS